MAIDRAAVAACSTRTQAVPRSALTCWIVSSNVSTILGASPSESSSIRSTCGSESSARPMTSICCSPPERLLAVWRYRSFSRGKIS